MPSMWGLVTLVGFALLISSATAKDEISINDFYVPPHVRLDENAVLQCPYDIKDQQLESVTWFFNDDEVYRYSMEDSQPNTLVFHNTSFTINLPASNDTQLVLENVQLSASGVYKCKIQTDSPHFKTAEEEGKLEVLVIPDKQPTMEGLPKKRLKPGANIRVKCSSPPSNPAASLAFQINKQELPKNFIKDQRTETNKNGLFVTHATLEVSLKRMYFKKGRANITCSSRIKTYDSLSEKLIVKSLAASIPEAFAILSVILVTAMFR